MIDLKSTFWKLWKLIIEEELDTRFDEVRNPPHTNRHLCAFLLLDKLGVLDDKVIIKSSWDYEVKLAVDCEKLAKVATEKDIEILVRCGIEYDNNGYLMIEGR